MRAFLVGVLLLVIGVIGLLAPAFADQEQRVFIQAIQPLGADEVVTIVNRGSQPVDLGGWRLESSNSLGQEVKETFWFPRQCPLPPGGTLRVHSGPAARGWASSTCTEGELAWLEVEVWNDKADVAWLRDSSGELVDLYTYTTGEAPSRPRAWPPFKPGEKAGLAELAGYSSKGAPACCPPVCGPPCLAAGCCVVRVILESIELVFNRGVGENWRLFASAGPVEPEVSPQALPLVLYEDLFRGEAFIQLMAGAVEQDLQPDRGWVRQELRLCCPLAPLERMVALEVYVRENEACCHSGCTALWRFTFKIIVEPFTWTRALKPPPPPRADFTIAPLGERSLGDIVILDGSPSVGEGLSYAWDFDGDGRVDAMAVRVEHHLAHEGMNLVTLTVTDRLGRSDSLTKGIMVKAPAREVEKQGLELGLFWLTLPAIAVGYFLAMAFRR